jgi:hypothetical protein
MSSHMVSIDDPLAQYIVNHTVTEHPAQAALREVTLGHPKGVICFHRSAASSCPCW